MCDIFDIFSPQIFFVKMWFEFWKYWKNAYACNFSRRLTTPEFKAYLLLNPYFVKLHFWDSNPQQFRNYAWWSFSSRGTLSFSPLHEMKNYKSFLWVFIFKKYGKFWGISLSNFIKHWPLNSEEYMHMA